MDALRRLFGGGSSGGAAEAAERRADVDAGPPPTAEELDAEERARELDLLRAEQDRLDDLVRRQQRYADRSWVPPAQGGPRRSDDGQDEAEGDR